MGHKHNDEDVRVMQKKEKKKEIKRWEKEKRWKSILDERSGEEKWAEWETEKE